MSMFLVQAEAALRKVGSGEPLNESDFAIILNESDITIISIALKQITRAKRTPFQRFRDHFIIGTERFKLYHGLDFLRTILMHKKNTVRHSGTNLGEISAVEVYTALQSEPPQAYNYNPEDATAEEYAVDSLGFDPNSDVGPSCDSSLQRILEPEGIKRLKNYARELKTHDSIAAVEAAQELEHWLRKHELGSYLRKHPKGNKYYIEPGNLEGIVKAFHKQHFYRGNPRTFRKPSQNIADNVRKSIGEALNKMRLSKNPATVDIADHLKNNITTGQICEYTGDWKWLFLEKS